MRICLFLSFRLRPGSSISAAESAKLDGFLGATPRLSKALVHTPARANDPYLDDGAPPQLVLQLYFTELPEMEDVLARGGHVAVLTSRDEFPAFVDADVAEQAMVVRPFAVREPRLVSVSRESYCTYLVGYDGEAADMNDWLAHYVGKHIAHMTSLPGLRELEVYTRVDWISALPFRRVNFMQRNKVAFDSEAALTQALHSPARHKMREDFRGFPPFSGRNTHHAMMTRVLQPS